ncbi:MAG: spore coat protein CotJC [Lachnospiraceae bacterium]|nr:spore coat protein CotJC [Lachnospiraceae bacterium]
MWNYEKRLQYPVNISTPNAKLASVIISQYGGPDGEMGASMRYLSQRYTMPYKQGQAVLTDIGREAAEMAPYSDARYRSPYRPPARPPL